MMPRAETYDDYMYDIDFTRKSKVYIPHIYRTVWGTPVAYTPQSVLEEYAIKRWNKHDRNDYLIRNPNISFEFIKKFVWPTKNQQLLEDILHNPNISFGFVKENIEQFTDNIDIDYFWVLFSKHPCVTMEIVDENPAFDWKYRALSSNPNLTILEIRKRGIDKFNWFFVSANPAIDMMDIENNSDLPWEFKRVKDNPNLTLTFIENHPELKEFEHLESVYFKSLVNQKKYFELISAEYIQDLWTTPKFSVEDISKDGVNYSQMMVASIDLIEKYSTKLDNDAVLYNPNLTSGFLEKHRNILSGFSDKLTLSSNKFNWENTKLYYLKRKTKTISMTQQFKDELIGAAWEPSRLKWCLSSSEFEEVKERWKFCSSL
jgi:hypothetical protein